MFLAIPVFTQQPTRVKLIKADDLKYNKRLGEGVQRLLGHVILKQDSTLLYCDSAHLNNNTNSFRGFGNVKIEVSDTLNIFSEFLNYFGNTKMAELRKNVRLVDSRATLYTEQLWYNRQTDIAWYETGGKIIDSSNVLTSKKGYYYTQLKEAYFKDSVVLINPDYRILTDTMLYHTETEVANFLGPTNIYSKENNIYCEHGWYDTRNNISEFNQNARITTDDQTLSADSIYYDRNKDYGIARHHVQITDTIQHMTLGGNYGEFMRKKGFAFVTDSALAIMIEKKDSLFLHADTLFIFFDDQQKAEKMKAYFKAKFFRKDLQGMCDSLVYNFKDSTIYLFKKPMLWSGINQLTADTIRIAMANNKIDTLAMINNSFIISVVDTITKSTFNQIKGKIMVGYFTDNKMRKVKIYGNAESVFYVNEEDGSPIGVNKTSSSDMSILIKDNKVLSITPIKDVDAFMYPPNEVPEEDKKLKNFIWIEGQRPLKKEDIFRWD